MDPPSQRHSEGNGMLVGTDGGTTGAVAATGRVLAKSLFHQADDMVWKAATSYAIFVQDRQAS